MIKKIFVWSIVVLLIGSIVFAQLESEGGLIESLTSIFKDKAEATSFYETKINEITQDVKSIDFKVIADKKVCYANFEYTGIPCKRCYSYSYGIDTKGKPNVYDGCLWFKEETNNEEDLFFIQEYLKDRYVRIGLQLNNVLYEPILEKPVICVSDKWLPSTDNYCELEVFEQNNECGDKIKAIGTKVCKEKEAITFGKTKTEFGLIVNPALETEDTEVISNEQYQEGRGEHDINSD